MTSYRRTEEDGKIHLVIPDPHARPDSDLSRFSYAGRLLVDLKPDVVVIMGDMADMESLSPFDTPGKKSFEGRRYKNDIAVFHTAMQMFLTPLREYNLTMKEQKKKQHKPHLVYCMGNHEERINRAVNNLPHLEGMISTNDLKIPGYGFTEVPFLDVINLDGINYSHYFVSGVMGRPVASASRLVQKGDSATMGHTHTLDWCSQVTTSGKRIHGLVCGVFDDTQHSYASQQVSRLWWPGLIIKRNVKDGDYEYESMSINRLKALYQDKTPEMQTEYDLSTESSGASNPEAQYIRRSAPIGPSL